MDGQICRCRNGEFLISFLHKRRQSNEDGQFSQLLDRELAEGFPNPNRNGCPDSDFLQRVVRHQVPISEIDPWIDHLGSCSECFGEFNRLKVASSARRRQRVILYAAAACVVLASAVLLWRQLRRAPEISTSGAAATNTAVTTGGRTGQQDVGNAGADRKSFEVILNLTQSTTRGEGSTNDRLIFRVPARLVACRMTLPLGSSGGLYYVRVQRAAQSEVLKTVQGNADVNNGDVRLDVELDLSNMSAGKYLLSYRHAGESWHHVPIVITNFTN